MAALEESAVLAPGWRAGLPASLTASLMGGDVGGVVKISSEVDSQYSLFIISEVDSFLLDFDVFLGGRFGSPFAVAVVDACDVVVVDACDVVVAVVIYADSGWILAILSTSDTIFSLLLSLGVMTLLLSTLFCCCCCCCCRLVGRRCTITPIKSLMERTMKEDPLSIFKAYKMNSFLFLSHVWSQSSFDCPPFLVLL